MNEAARAYAIWQQLVFRSYDKTLTEGERRNLAEAIQAMRWRMRRLDEKAA